MIHHKRISDSFSFETSLYIRPPDATHCLRCGYHNFLGLTQQQIKNKVKQTIVPVVNGVLAPLGWQYIDAQCFGNFFEIYYKEASPAEPITVGTVITILTLTTIIIVGLVIVWVTWVYLETKKDLAKAKQDKKKLLEEGKITNEQYTQLIEAQAEEDMFGALGKILPLLFIFLIIMAIAGAIPKRGKE